MDYTTNYQLPVWAETDRILRTDFNSMTEKIEEAFSSHDTTLETIQTNAAATSSVLTQKGNCKTFLTSYVGTGNAQGTRPITFPSKPFLVILLDAARYECYPLPYGVSQTHGSRNTLLTGVTWSGNLLNLPMASGQAEVNEQGRLYQAFALLE